MKKPSRLSVLLIVGGIFLIILYIAIKFRAFPPAIHVHELLHCFGAKLIGYECMIEGNVASLSVNIQEGEILKSFIYSGMPYIIFTLLTLPIFFFRRSISKNVFLMHSCLLFLLLFFSEFLFNLIEIGHEGNDFSNILLVDGFISVALILFLIASFGLLFCKSLKYFWTIERKNVEKLTGYLRLKIIEKLKKRKEERRGVKYKNRWKIVLNEIYQFSPNRYGRGRKGDWEALAEKTDLSGTEVEEAIGFLNDMKLIKLDPGYHFVILEEKGFNVALSNEKEKNSLVVQRLLIVFTSLLAYSALVEVLKVLDVQGSWLRIIPLGIIGGLVIWWLRARRFFF